MKISGTVEICNRVLPSLNLSNRRPERSHLRIGSVVGKRDSLFLHHQTLNNGVGVKYRLSGNVLTVFSRFVSEGKATIRFKDPPHDLVIKSNAENLKHFLKILKLGHEGKQIQAPLLSSNPKKVIPNPKVKLIINSCSEIPRLTGYARTLEILQICSSSITKVDNAILRLQNLKVLNFSSNSIEAIPPNLDLLINLRELHVANNLLGKSADWRWMKSKSIQDKLLYLDMSSNQISKLPNLMNKFKALKTLLLDNNKLTALPSGLGLLASLRILQLSHNSISYLPSSFRFLRLERVDVSGNLNGNVIFCTQFAPSPEPTLVDRAAMVVLSERVTYDWQELPWTLCEYLEGALYCGCGTAVLPPVVVAAVPFDLRRVSNSVTTTTGTNPLIGLAFCSPRCRSSAYLSFKMIFHVGQPQPQ